MNRKFPICLLLGALLTVVFFSCNKVENEGELIYSNSVVISKFALQANDDIMENLDTVFFTIDLDRGLVYNADSLPVGTSVSSLKVDMTYAEGSSAEFQVTGGEWMRDTVFKYNSEDSIDFTGDVKFKIISRDMMNEKTYTIKVNVHKVEPDTLYWGQMARRDLPSYTTPLEQRTAQFNDKLYCFIKDLKGYIMSITSDPLANRWEKNRIELPFTPDLSSFTATDDALYVLDSEKTLYTSTDGLNWTTCGVKWYSVIGSYENTLLGVTEEGGVYKHAQYPASESFVATEVPADFPITGMSQMVKLESRWALNDQKIMIGGETASGEYCRYTWGFDGSVWGIVCRENMTIGRLKGVTLIPYYCTYFDYESLDVLVEPTLLAVGGHLDDGTILREVMMSIDNGLTWTVGNDCLQLPEYIEPFTGAQAFVINSTLTESRSMSSAWTEMQTKLPASMRINSRAIKPVTSWECPYIYLIGGVNEYGELNNNIWRGVINRFTFKPLY